MKRKLLKITAVVLGVGVLCSCGQKEDTAETDSTEIANPWTECSLDELKGYFPDMRFPSNAENVTCMYMDSEGIGEADYNVTDEDPALDYTLRLKKTDGLEDFSGYYYDWTSTDDLDILRFPEESKTYISDDLEIQMVNWYDTDTGICYSLSVQADFNLDGFDIYSRVLDMYEDGSALSDGTGEDASADGDELYTHPMTVSPLPSGLDIDNLTDCTVHASFSVDNFNWRGGNLTFHVWDETLYDAAEVANLQVGDTIEVDGQAVEIQTLEDTDYCRMINASLPDETMLAPGEGGTYYIFGYDDEVGMTDLGETELILSDDVVLNDCGDMPEDAYTFTSSDMKAYLDGLSESRQNFGNQATTIVVENGLITEINRGWRP